MTLGELIPLERPIIFFDCETTGPIPSQDRIVELGFLVLKPGVDDPVKWRSLVNPGIPIPPEATHGNGDYPGHGITDEMVQGCRLCSEPRARHNPSDLTCSFQAWPSFADLTPGLLRGFKQCDYGGFNCKAFDLPLVKAEFGRNGHPEWSYADARILDAYRLWQLGQKRTLSDAVDVFLGRQHDGAHGALSDIEATLEVVVAQLIKFMALPHTMGQLHDLQWPVDPNAIDPEGKFIWKNGLAVCNFGVKWRNAPLHKIDKGYLKWMAGPQGTFSPEVKFIVKEALEGRLPKKETTS